MQIANVAAGVVVGKRGGGGLRRAAGYEINGSRAGLSAEALSLADAKALRERWAREGRTVSFTNGCFDILPAVISRS